MRRIALDATRASDSAVSTGNQLPITGASAAVIFLAVDMVFIALARRTANRLSGNPLIKRLVKYFGASLLGLFGLRLLLSRE